VRQPQVAGVDQNQGQIQTEANAQREKKAEKETPEIQVKESSDRQYLSVIFEYRFYVASR